MDGRIKQSYWSAEAKPGQLSCFIHFTSFSSLIFTYVMFFFKLSPLLLEGGYPDFFILAIVISVWTLGAATGGGRGGGTTRCPCWKRCIKTVMSHPICRTHLLASKGGSSVPLFSPSLQSEPFLPPSLAFSPSLLTLLPALPVICQQLYSGSECESIGSTVPINNPNYLYVYSVGLVLSSLSIYIALNLFSHLHISDMYVSVI